MTSASILERPRDLFVRRGVPDYIRSDNGPEFTATRVREGRLGRVDVKVLFIEHGSPQETGDIESFDEKMQDELLEREIFDTLLEAKILMERWCPEYSTVRPHSSWGYRRPASDARPFIGWPQDLHAMPQSQRK